MKKEDRSFIRWVSLSCKIFSAALFIGVAYCAAMSVFGLVYNPVPYYLSEWMLGTSLVLPVHKGRIQTGTWQGIWLGEHRIHGGSRRIIATLQGE